MHSSYQDFADEEESSSLDLKVLVLYGLFRSKVWVVALTVVGLSVGLLIGAAAPNEYQSEARLRYVPGERDRLTDDELAGLEAPDRRGAAPGLTDEIMLLQNPLIYQRVASELGAVDVLEPPDPEQYDTPETSRPVRMLHELQKALIAWRSPEVVEESPKAHSAAWRELRANTTLETVPNASTIRVLVRAPSAERAQRYCAALVDAFQERHREVFSAEARLEEQRRKVAEAHEHYQKLENDYYQYRVDCGVFDYKEDNEANQESLREVNKQLDEREGKRQKLIAQIGVYEERLAEIEEFVQERIDPVIGENPEYTSLQAELRSVNRDLTLLVDQGLPERLMEQRRETLENQRENLEERLEEVEPTIELMPVRTERRKNPEYYELQTRLTELRSERDGVIADIEYLKEKQGLLIEDRKRIASCKDKHFMHGGWVNAAQQDLRHQQEQLDKLEKLALAEMKGASALKPLWDPTLPLGKVGPSRLKPLLAGLAVGLFLGMAVAVLRQLLDRRLRYPETLERNLGLKVIGVVPEVRRLRALRGGGGTPTAA